MLRAAHYKADAVDGPVAGRSPPKHRTGGIMDLALTAADKYALSLLPAALKGTGLASNDGPATDYRAVHQYPSNGISPAYKTQRAAGNPLLHNPSPAAQELQMQQQGVDSRVATSWDASLKEILAALEPESRTLKPAKLRDHKYPNQNHGMPTNTVIPPPRRELDEALVTLPGGTRRHRGGVPPYAAAFKGLSRQSRRPEPQGNAHPGGFQTVDVQYDVVPSVKLAWAGPANGTYSTTGFGGSPKKYTSQLVGRVSPHYAGTTGLQQPMGSTAGTQDPLHLPEIANGTGHATANQAGGFRGSNTALPSYQSWTNATTPTPTGTAGYNTQSRRALPYVSTNAPSLAKPLTVQYHPVLKSPSNGAGAGSLYTQTSGGAPGSSWASRATTQRPATDHGPAVHQPGGPGAGDAGKLYPRYPYGSQPSRLPQTPPEVAAEVARLRHAQELDGVINGVRSDLRQAASIRPEGSFKSKFLQMYEDPNRPLSKLNPKHLLGDVAPASSQQQRRNRPPGIVADRPQPSSDGGPLSTSPSSSGAARSPMYERRLRPLPSDIQPDGDAAGSGSAAGPTGDGADGDALSNVHLQPPELPGGASLEEATQPEHLETVSGEATSLCLSTPRSSQLEREDTALTEADLGTSAADAEAAPELPAAGVDAAGPGEEEQSGVAIEAAEPQEPGGGEAAPEVEAEAARSDGDAPAVEGVSMLPVEGEPEATAGALEATGPTETSKQESERETEQVGLVGLTEQAAATQQKYVQQDGQAQPPDAGDAASANTQGTAELSPPESCAEPVAAVQEPAENSQQEQPCSSAPGDGAAAAESCGTPEELAQQGPSEAVEGGAGPLLNEVAEEAPAEATTSEAPQDDSPGVRGSEETVGPASGPEPEPVAAVAGSSGAGEGEGAEAPRADADQEGLALDSDAPTCMEQEGEQQPVEGEPVAAVSESGAAANEPAEAAVSRPAELPLDGEAAAADRPDGAVEGDAEPPTPEVLDAADAAAAFVPPAEDVDKPEAPSTVAEGTDAVATAPDAVDSPPAESPDAAPPLDAVAEEVAGASDSSPTEAGAAAAEAGTVEAEAAARPAYTLPPGVTPEMARASAVCIQSHARGYQARRRLAAMRKKSEAGPAAPQPPQSPIAPSSPARKQVVDYELPQGVTQEMARAAVVRIQSHARGYFARRQVAELRKGREAGEAALATAVSAVAARKEDGFELKLGVTPEIAEAAAIRVQAHMRGHLARRHVTRLRAERAPPPPAPAPAEALAEAAAAPGAADEGHTGQGLADADTTLREAGEAVSSGAGAEEEAVVAPLPEAPVEPEEMTIDALKAALADDDEEAAADGDVERRSDVAGPEGAAGSTALEEAPVAPAPLDMSDPAAVAAAAAAAAAAAKAAAIRVLDDAGAHGSDGIADTTAAADQAAEEASMARLAATSARTSAMFQGAGAEMRYSDDEASALELMDNLDGLLQGDDEAAAAAAAVAAAAAPADGEIVSISADGVSEPQSLGAGAAGSAANPMDATEPGGVRVLAGKYEVQHVVGEGAYGMVMKCKVRGTEPVQWVAIKEFKIDDNDPDAEDVKRTSLREVSVLEALQHPHVVGFVDKFMVGDRLFIVMEFLPCNLLELLEAQPGGMDRDAVRLIMFQLCSAIAFIHTKGMVYRDIKPENLLVDEHGTVKLCDFGFARYLPSGPKSHLTDYVATRWYRAPELLLGPPYRDALGKHVQYMYGPPVDMWAVGCLMGELLDGEPLFAGDSDLDQLYRVQQILGPMAPSHQYMFYANPHNTGIVFNIKQPVTLGSRYRGKVSDVELHFMSGLLEMDPDKRLTGEQCLQHPYLLDLAAAANALPTPSPTSSNAPTATNMSLEDGSGGGEQGPGTGDASSGNDLATAESSKSASPFPGARVSESREGLGSRGLEKAGSLTRAAGSLTRGGRSLSRGPVSPVQLPLSSSPGPGSGPQRGGSKLLTSENGQVVIVEGVEEEGEEARRGAPTRIAALQSVSTLPEVAAVISEIEPADEDDP
ncbi:hypothetical protein PLESTB_000521600 [Pleodorina starrii]|uniref:Protein kinase domain-containing protein n=1 Tax=Pleodorina starrii TaxID=330485 RepID=A0A9W6F0Y7_9CHLO|nr:hypothetical protein PLESTM_000385100 [Pleodorina starrii]GLC51616.1 hypothetical protein PLESTB_000521600 [Pleodorina starrii]GLC72385.1 hypothetical protein PLESTF_001241900 [Pleodorina starrii]